MSQHLESENAAGAFQRTDGEAKTHEKPSVRNLMNYDETNPTLTSMSEATGKDISADAQAALSADISWYASMRDTMPTETITIEMLCGRIHGDATRHLIKPARAALDAGLLKEYDLIKQKLPCTTLSGCGPGRTKAQMTEHSGVIQADIDAKDNPSLARRPIEEWRARIAAHQHVLFACISPNGRGLKVGVLVPPDFSTHRDAYRQVEDLFQTEFGLCVDKACRDEARLMFVPSDPGIVVNRLAIRMPVPDVVRAITRSSGKFGSPTVPSAYRERIRSIIRFYAKRGRPDYNLWLRIIAVAILVLGHDEAMALLSEVLPEETPGEYAAKFASPLTKIAPETFIAEAVTAGWRCGALLDLPEAAKVFVTGACYQGQSYAIKTPHGYSSVNATAMSRHLVEQGVPANRVRACLSHIEREQSVSMIIDLFARPVGIHEENGYRVLVTKATILLPAKPGKFEKLSAFLVEMLGETQYPYFLGWLKQARRAFASGSSVPGQALIIAGPVKTGKSLLIALLSKCLGDRSASASDYFVGGTAFNREVATVGLLTVDDDLDGSTKPMRAKMMQRIKSNQFGRKMPLTSKYADTITIEPINRLVIAMNDTEGALESVPRKASDTEDKILLLQAHRVDGGMLHRLMEAATDVDTVLASLETELPAFLAFVESYEISPDLRDSRTGVKSFWNPELLALMDDGSSDDDRDARIVELLEAVACGGSVEVTASALIEMIHAKNPASARYQLRDITPSVFGRVLSRIANRRPDLLVRGKEVDHTVRWVLRPRADTQNGAADRARPPESAHTHRRGAPGV